MINIESIVYLWSICLVLNAMNLFMIDLMINRAKNPEDAKLKYELVGYFNLAPKNTPTNRKYLINSLGYILAPAIFVITGISTTLAVPVFAAFSSWKVLKPQFQQIKKLRGINEKK